MPRKISFINELTDEAAIMAAEYCPMCGAVKGEPNETDRTEHKDSELIRKIAQLFMEDKTTLHVLLYYVSYPLATVQQAASNLQISTGSVCTTRKKIARLYPSFSGMLGLKTKTAIAQQGRSLKVI